MNTQQIDDQLRLMLTSLPHFSRLGTCLKIRIADYAAQLCGCRSTRQINDSKADDVEDNYNDLLNQLYCHVDECINYLNSDHSYKDEIHLMDEDSLELMIEDVLFEMTTHDCRFIFEDMMLS